VIQQFDCLRSSNRDVVWLANVTVFDKTLKCGLAYIQGNIPTTQPLIDSKGNQICLIHLPLEYADTKSTFNLLSSTDDDLVFQITELL